MANDVSTEYVDPYTNPAELAMTTQDKMLMAQIASEAPELHPFLARNPNIYPDLLDWLASLNDSAVNAAIRLRK